MVGNFLQGAGLEIAAHYIQTDSDLAQKMAVPLVVYLRRAHRDNCMKKQIWLTAEHIELVVACLRKSRNEMVGPKTFLNEFQKVACEYSARRIDDVLKLFQTPKPPEQNK